MSSAQLNDNMSKFWSSSTVLDLAWLFIHGHSIDEGQPLHQKRTFFYKQRPWNVCQLCVFNKMSRHLMTPTSDWDISAVPCEVAWNVVGRFGIFVIFSQLMSECSLPIQNKGSNVIVLVKNNKWIASYSFVEQKIRSITNIFVLLCFLYFLQ